MTENISLEYIGRRLDDLQRDAQHHRVVSDMLIKQIKSLYAEFDAQRAHLHVIDSRLERIDGRLERLDERLGGLDHRLDRMEQLLQRFLDARL